MSRAAPRRIDVGASPVLRRWLGANLAFDAEYGDRLSNHLPMALMALQRLGADDARLHAFAQGYAARLRPAPRSAWRPAGEAWVSRLGHRGAWPAYRQLFAQWLLRAGVPGVLEAALPRLLPGCAGAAFHGLIRTAYAVQAGECQELADALAHWACVWQPLPAAPAGATRGEPDPAAVLRRLPRPTGP
ncbi:MAG: DUF4243 domain-containing protein, partial [Burkholderiales bacterium]|nr:DUF4243 domain-containing protein [Burkholderiales bacterium]